MPQTILIVDDVASIRKLLHHALSAHAYTVFTAPSAEAALEMLERQAVDVVISDEKMPGMNGSEFLAIVRKKHPDTVRIILTGHATLDAAIRAINEGEIYRFLTKPCNMVDLAITVRQALEQRDLQLENRRLSGIIEKQEAELATLESRHPGITKIKRDEGGAVIIDEEP